MAYDNLAEMFFDRKDPSIQMFNVNSKGYGFDLSVSFRAAP